MAGHGPDMRINLNPAAFVTGTDSLQLQVSVSGPQVATAWFISPVAVSPSKAFPLLPLPQSRRTRPTAFARS